MTPSVAPPQSQPEDPELSHASDRDPQHDLFLRLLLFESIQDDCHSTRSGGGANASHPTQHAGPHTPPTDFAADDPLVWDPRRLAPIIMSEDRILPTYHDSNDSLHEIDEPEISFAQFLRSILYDDLPFDNDLYMQQFLHSLTADHPFREHMPDLAALTAPPTANAHLVHFRYESLAHVLAGVAMTRL